MLFSPKSKFGGRVDYHHLFAAIEGEKSHFVGCVRDYVRAQLPLWQRVPMAALRADDGLGGGRYDDYSLAYHSGRWKIRDSSVHTLCAIAVDCATGELVRAIGIPEAASDAAVFRAGMKLELLDAHVVLRQLAWESGRPGGLPAPSGHASVEEWREAIIMRTGLSEIYAPRVLV